MVLDPQLEQIMSNAVQSNGGVIEPNLVDTVITGIAEATGKNGSRGGRARSCLFRV
jgi:hypothetical protein